MKKILGFLLVLVFASMAAQKVVLDQSIIIRWVPGHYDTVWTDGIKAAVWVPAKQDTTIPVMEARRTYKVTDTIINGGTEIVDSTDNFFVYMVRKHGARVVTLDTFKIVRMQPRSSILTKTIIQP